MRIWLLAILLAGTIQSGLCQDQQSATSPEELRFNEQKQIRKRQALQHYIRDARRAVEKAWQPENNSKGQLEITKIKLTIDETGKVKECKMISASKSPKQDKVISERLSGYLFTRLPVGQSSLELFYTFMNDGTMNMVENTQSVEASNYYNDLLGGTINEQGVLVSRSGSVFYPSIRQRPRLNIVPTPADEAPPQRTAEVPAPPSTRSERTIINGVDYGPYLSDLQRRIKRAWFPPKGGESKRIKVGFEVHRGGEIAKLSVIDSSGDAVADQSALKAVENASPFRPLPAGAKDDIKIQFTFDYAAHGSSGHAQLIQ